MSASAQPGDADAAPLPLVAHVDDERTWTEFGDGPDGDAVWYLHKQTVEEGAAATMRCGLFRVAPAPLDLTLPYHETIVTLAGEGTTTVGDQAIEIAPGRQLFLEHGATASFAPRTKNIEFITVIETGGAAEAADTASAADAAGGAGEAAGAAASGPVTGIAVLDGAEPALLNTAAAAPAVTAGTVRLDAGEHDERSDADRSLVVLEGEGELLLPDGSARQVRAGTIAFLPRGQRIAWTIRQPLRAFVTEVR